MQFALVPCANGFAQWGNATRGCVLGFVLLNGTDSRLLDVVRGWKVRLARTEVGHVDALGLQLFRFGKDGGGRRDLDSVDAVGELHLKLLRRGASCSHQFTGTTQRGKHRIGLLGGARPSRDSWRYVGSRAMYFVSQSSL